MRPVVEEEYGFTAVAGVVDGLEAGDGLGGLAIGEDKEGVGRRHQATANRSGLR